MMVPRRFPGATAGPNRALSSQSAESEIEPLVFLPSLMALLVALAHESNDIIRDVAQSDDLGVIDKKLAPETIRSQLGDLQTEADRRVEARILDVLRAQYPFVRIIAEEETETQQTAAAGDVSTAPPPTVDGEVEQMPWNGNTPVESSRVVVYVDPLDGTNEFASGNFELCTTLLGVCVDGKPMGGVIGQAFFNLRRDEDGKAHRDDLAATPGRVVYGGPGVGVHGLEEESRSSASTSPQLIVGLNRGVRDERIEPAMEKLKSSLPSDQSIRISRGSASGWHCLQLMEQKHDVYLHLRAGTKKWDTAPGEAILDAMGGRLTNVAGERYQYDGNHHKNISGVVASLCNETHATALSAIEGVVAQYVRDTDDPSVRKV